MKRTCICGASIEQPDWSEMMSMDSLLKIVGYEACTGACAEELATNVQDKMARLADDGELMGWVPYGNPCTAVYSNGSIEYFQMVVRYE